MSWHSICQGCPGTRLWLLGWSYGKGQGAPVSNARRRQLNRTAAQAEGNAANRLLVASLLRGIHWLTAARAVPAAYLSGLDEDAVARARARLVVGGKEDVDARASVARRGTGVGACVGSAGPRVVAAGRIARPEPAARALAAEAARFAWRGARALPKGQRRDFGLKAGGGRRVDGVSPQGTGRRRPHRCSSACNPSCFHTRRQKGSRRGRRTSPRRTSPCRPHARPRRMSPCRPHARPRRTSPCRPRPRRLSEVRRRRRWRSSPRRCSRRGVGTQSAEGALTAEATRFARKSAGAGLQRERRRFGIQSARMPSHSWGCHRRSIARRRRCR